MDLILRMFVSTHSRPKAAEGYTDGMARDILVSTHSRPKAADFFIHEAGTIFQAFQHTAARRRLCD